MDRTTGMSYVQNHIQHKNLGNEVKTVFLCDAWVGRDLCLKIVDKSNGTGH